MGAKHRCGHEGLKDSGFVVLDKDQKLVGLLFAGNETVTVINGIQNVFDLLGIKEIQRDSILEE